MSIKKTRIHYPHIVKEYDSVEQLISENGYTDFYNEIIAGMVAFGIDVDDETQYKEALSEDLFEAVSTVIFASEEAYAEYEANTPECSPSTKAPIFIEESEDHIL